MNLAYADPPYPGQARRHYADQPLCQEVNHQILIGTLVRDYDGWALSTGSVNLRNLLPLCPPETRVAAWVKPFSSWKKNVVPANAWEPVLYRSCRKRTMDRKWATLGVARDWHMATQPVFLGRGGKIKGPKPLSFCLWILDLIGFERGDALDDLFPGSRVMAEALEIYGRQREMFS